MDAETAYLKKVYARVFVKPDCENVIAQVKCNQCQQSFLQRYHPFKYFCPFCRLFNCDLERYLESSRDLDDQMLDFDAKHACELTRRTYNWGDVCEVVQEMYGKTRGQLEEALEDVSGGISLNRVVEAIEQNIVDFGLFVVKILRDGQVNE